MPAFQNLYHFIADEMRMSHVYQPVMLMELLKNDGQASVTQIAQAILDKDPTQIEYFTEIVKNMVGKVLTKNRGITEKSGDTYKLIGSEHLTDEQIIALIELCQSKIVEFESKREGDVENPRGVFRHIIAGKVFYEEKK